MSSQQEDLLVLIRDALDLQGRVERNPYGMVAGALSVGYLLGGGLFTRLTERLASAALRAGLMALLPNIERQLGLAGARDGRRTRERGA